MSTNAVYPSWEGDLGAQYIVVDDASHAAYWASSASCKLVICDTVSSSNNTCGRGERRGKSATGAGWHSWTASSVEVGGWARDVGPRERGVVGDACLENVVG